MKNSPKGNIFGIFAIIIWSSMAFLAVMTKNIPPFLLLALCLLIAFIIGLIYFKIQNFKFNDLKQPVKVYLVGIFGIFGYHFFYFFAIQNSSSIEANLINYLWPLFIVLFSSFLPHEKLEKKHILGSIFGFLGVALLVGKNASFQMQYLLGYFSAFLAAIFWASYSVISSTFKKVNSSIIMIYCLFASLLSFLCHFIFEKSVSINLSEFLGIVLLGLGPVGGAFYLWDIGMKKGSVKLLGTLAYFIPLLSTLLLIFFTPLKANIYIWISCFLIIIGSLVATKKN